MSYTVQIFRRAQKELAGLPPQVYPRVRDAIRDLANIPRPAGCKKLIGRSGWRIRAGDYRIIYEIHPARLSVILKSIHR